MRDMPEDPANAAEAEFDDDDGPAAPGDMIMDFSTDSPTVWTVPEPDQEELGEAPVGATRPVDTLFFPVGGDDRFEGTIGDYLARGEGEWAAEATAADGRPAVVIDDGTMADLLPEESSDFGMTVHLFASVADRTAWVAAQRWTAGR